MNLNYILGICVSNNDPQNFGRIRAIPINVLGRISVLSDVLNYINELDDVAVIEKKYEPWTTVKKGEFRERDPYLCEPFLPKHIGLLPKTGQLVKIIKSDVNNNNEFIGPYTIDQLNLTEEYRNVINNLQYPSNINEVIPKQDNFYLSGYNNEQVILGDNQAIIRLGHVDKNKKRKVTYPFIQLSQYNNSYDIKDEVTTQVIENEFIIDYIMEIDIINIVKNSATHKNLIGNIHLFSTKNIINQNNLIGVTNFTYRRSDIYNKDNFLVTHRIECNNITDFKSKINEIIVSYKDNKKIPFFNKTIDQQIQRFDTDNVSVITNNRFTNFNNSGGGINDTVVIPDLNTWIFRLNPRNTLSSANNIEIPPNLPENSLEYIRIIEFNNLLSLTSDLKNEMRFGKFLINDQQVIQKTNKVLKINNKPNTSLITHSDKTLILTHKTKGIIRDKFNDGISSETFNILLDDIKTYGVIRGENLLKLLLDIIDIITNHGHVAGVNPLGSMEETTKERLSEMKNRILRDLNYQNRDDDKTSTINHNFRLD